MNVKQKFGKINSKSDDEIIKNTNHDNISDKEKLIEKERKNKSVKRRKLNITIKKIILKKLDI